VLPVDSMLVFIKINADTSRYSPLKYPAWWQW